MLVAIADASEDVAELAHCCCVDGLGDIGVSVRWCDDEEADWGLVEDQFVASQDTGGGLWCYYDVVRQVPGVAPAFVGIVGYIRPADDRSQGDRVHWEESEFLSLSVMIVLSFAFFGLFLDEYRY